MASSQALDCSASVLAYPSIFGAEFTSISATLVQNYTDTFIPGTAFNFNSPKETILTVSFCNVTLTHTHPGLEDSTTTEILLPVHPAWNGRLQAIGGGGWRAGLGAKEAYTLPAIARGYATVKTNGGTPTNSPDDWALLSPGVVNIQLLSNFASRSLHDGVLAAKSIINSAYGREAEYSYWIGCSTGGRQGYAFAQKYPDVFDGIAAGAPAINWHRFFLAVLSPQLVMNEAKAYVHPCELNALTRAAVAACDGLDGLVDGVISYPDECDFDAYSVVGRELDGECWDDAATAPRNISQLAAHVADTAWNGFRARETGELLWPTVGREANLTTGVADTSCPADGTPCKGLPWPLILTLPRLFVAKDAQFDWKSWSRAKFEDLFHVENAGAEAAIMATDSADLSVFKTKGGKLLSWHGLADEIIPFGGTRHYYNAVTALDSDVQSFYRLFEAPGVGHCDGGAGGYPAGAFDALVQWVEKGVVPKNLVATNSGTNQSRILCPYPTTARFVGKGPEFEPGDFVCE